MALGHTIGHCARLSQNNDHLYTVSDGGRAVTPALMGDPTLRLQVVRPPGALSIVQLGASTVRLTWSPSDDTVEGYNIYRAPSLGGEFERLNVGTCSDTSFIDVAPLAGNNVYMVRALKLETSGGGTYYNLSCGVVDSLGSAAGVPETGTADLRLGNPVRGITRIRYFVPVSGNVSLRLYDVAGREVKRLVEGEVGAGWYAISWDGRDEGGARAASGVYFCRLRTPDGRRARRFVLLR
jgi:hypothetical protein